MINQFFTQNYSLNNEISKLLADRSIFKKGERLYSWEIADRIRQHLDTVCSDLNHSVCAALQQYGNSSYNEEREILEYKLVVVKNNKHGYNNLYEFT